VQPAARGALHICQIFPVDFELFDNEKAFESAYRIIIAINIEIFMKCKSCGVRRPAVSVLDVGLRKLSNIGRSSDG
jgi:hypothetical protein